MFYFKSCYYTMQYYFMPHIFMFYDVACYKIYLNYHKLQKPFSADKAWSLS